MVSQMLKGLQWLHKNGLIHRDLNTKNIFITKKDKIINMILGDFGFAKQVSNLNKLARVGANIDKEAKAANDPNRARVVNDPAQPAKATKNTDETKFLQM